MIRSHKYIAVAGVLVLAGIAAGLIGFVMHIGGVQTVTMSPTPEQITHGRGYLYIAPDIEIEPLAYYVKSGMDHIVAFKFIAKTDDPSLVFDSAQIDSSEFSANFRRASRRPMTIGGTSRRSLLRVRASGCRMPSRIVSTGSCTSGARTMAMVR